MFRYYFALRCYSGAELGSHNFKDKGVAAEVVENNPDPQRAG